eukprot:9316940-Ditylum_brightwellii.AAC.1
MDKAYEYKAFKSLGNGRRKLKNHVMICVYLVYDVKQDGRCKARLVTGSHMTGPNSNTYYSSVVSLRAIRIMIFLAELNGMELIVTNIGKEFQDYGHDGHLILIVKVLYELKTSGARFHEKVADTMYQFGLMPSKSNSDIWMKDCKDHWEYLKGVSKLAYYLGGDFKRRMLASYEQLFGESMPKQEVHAPLEPGNYPEIEDYPLLDMEDTKKYWQMIGGMQWAVSLGCIDIIAATMTVARFRPAPCQGHLKYLKH